MELKHGSKSTLTWPHLEGGTKEIKLILKVSSYCGEDSGRNEYIVGRKNCYPQNCIEKYMFDYRYQRSAIKVYDRIYKLADKKE